MTGQAVLLTGRCERKRHLMFSVLDTGDGLVIEAKNYAAGRERDTWTPLRRELHPGRVTRYGCPCGRSELLADSEMQADIGRGITRWIIAGSNISRKRRSGMGEPAPE